MANTFQVTRDIFEKDIFRHHKKFILFLYIFGKARWDLKPTKKGNVEICRGQYLRSFRKLQEDLEYIENNAVKQIPLGTIKRYIDELISEERLTTRETELGTLFTITNYELYQSFKQKKKTGLEQGMNSIGTGNEQGLNNRKTEKTGKQEKQENKELGTLDLIFPEKLDNDVFKKTFNEWTEYRKEIKKPLTNSAIKKQLNFLAKQPNPAAVIEQSIMNSWQGLFELKNQTNGTNKPTRRNTLQDF